MNILVVYATYSSGTFSAANIIVDDIKAANHQVTLKEAATVDPHEFSSYDLIIMGSPSWWVNETDGMPHEHYLGLMERAQGLTFSDRKFAIYGLGDESYMHFCGAVDKLEKFVTQMQGVLIGESLRMKDYYMQEDVNAELIHAWVNRIIHT